MKINPMVVDLSHYDNVGPTPPNTTLQGFKEAYASGIRGVINKVTEGPGIIDKSFGWRRKPALAAGLLYAAYHFIRPGDVALQVDKFLAAATPDDKLGLALDHEDRRVPLDAAREFLERVHDKTGRWPSLYSGFLVKEQLGSKKDKFWAGIRLWLSHYSSRPTWPPCWSVPWLWQYTGDGVGPSPHGVPGIEPGHQLDINSFDGTEEELAKTW